MDPDPASKQPA